MNRALSVLLCLMLSAPLGAAERLPDLGESAQAGFSSQQERVVGENIMQEVRADKTYFDDPEVVDYLQTLGQRLVAVSDDAGRDFDFFLMRDATLNAFALPGAHIGIHSGLILAAQGESELAAVMAHEIAHVTQRHIARQVAGEQTRSLTSLAALAIAILAARSNSDAAQAAIATAQAANIQSMLDFTREHEREADRVGLQILGQAGFDPSAMATFFERLQRYGRIHESNAPQYLRTHPITSERIADVQNRLSAMPYRQVLDGSDFAYIRAKLRASIDAPKDSLRYFEGQIRDRAPKIDPVAQYGYSLALTRLRRFADADKALEVARSNVANRHPMVENLAAGIRIANKQYGAAEEVYREAVKRFPERRALVYGYADLLLAGNNAGQALSFLNDRLQLTSGDARLYELQGAAYAKMGKRLLQHQAQAEAYVRRGNLTAAIDQLQVAMRGGDGDFYQKSAVEARLKELKAQAEEQKKAKAN